MFAQTISDKSPIQDQRGFIRADSMKCDGKTDDTAIFDGVVTSAVSDHGPAAAPVELQTIQLPSGKCRFASAPKPIPAGIKILGNANRNGTWLIADYDEADPNNGFLTWNASYPALGGGLGGGLEHVHLSKGDAKIGGTAIKLSGRDDMHRSGFMVFNDIYINSAFGAAGYWHRNFFIDGACCTTPGSNGIRAIMLTNFHFAQSRPPHEGESILVRNGVHIHMNNGVVFASQQGGITVTGFSPRNHESSDDVLISNVQIEGALVIDNVEGFVFSGWVAGKVQTGLAARRCFVSGLVEGAIDNRGHCGITTDEQTFIPNVLFIAGKDSAGHLTLENGLARHRFIHPFPVAPICTASDNNGASAVRVVSTPSELTVSGVADHSVSYICVGQY